MNNSRQQFGGPWTDQKLECIKKYLQAYTTIMKKQKFRFAYIDAFAGTGYRELPHDDNPNKLMFPELTSQDTRGWLEGSAQIALEVEPPFQKYVFIEKDPKRFAELVELREESLRNKEWQEDSITCEQEDANTFLRKLCTKNWRKHRALVFLDPYGMQVEWETIKSIAKTQAIDLWMLFPLGTVNRLLKNDGEIRDARRYKLNSVFGDDYWFQTFYQLAKQISMFDEKDRWQKTDDIFAEVEQYFMKQLQGIFAGVADNPLSLRNSKNVPLYLLCFAAGNPRGAPTAVKIAQHILSGMQNPPQPTFSK